MIDKLREVANVRCPDYRPEGFRFIDLFAGIGGLRLPFDEIGGRCVFTSEWDRFCKETYTANFPEPSDSDHEFVGDIRPYAANPETVPAHDVLLAGFPCQPFSIAGVSKKNALGQPHGFLCDTQGTLFYDLAEILRHHRPPAFLLENVRNLERHDGGRTFATIVRVLENELDYSVSTRVIDSSPWVPQKRQRIFMVGFTRKPSSISMSCPYQEVGGQHSEQSSTGTFLPSIRFPSTFGTTSRTTRRSTVRPETGSDIRCSVRMMSPARYLHATTRTARKFW